MIHVSNHQDVIHDDVQSTVANLVKNHVPPNAINLSAIVFIDSACLNNVDGLKVIVEDTQIPVNFHQILAGTNIGTGTTIITYEIPKKTESRHIETETDVLTADSLSSNQQNVEDALRRRLASEMPFTITNTHTKITHQTVAQDSVIRQGVAVINLVEGISLQEGPQGHCALVFDELLPLLESPHPTYTSVRIHDLTYGNYTNLRADNHTTRQSIERRHHYRLTLNKGSEKIVIDIEPR